MSEKSVCDNCGRVFPDEKLKEVHDFWGRVLPGETMPSGECPDCGSLCFPKEDKKNYKAKNPGSLCKPIRPPGAEKKALFEWRATVNEALQTDDDEEDKEDYDDEEDYEEEDE